MKVLVTNIDYDTDGEALHLPEKLEIELPYYLIEEEEITNFLSDEISSLTGFCHFGFSYKFI